jgi:hypothetical protein
MSETQETSAVVRLKAIQQHISSDPDPSSTRKAADLQSTPIEGQKYFPKPQPFNPHRPVKVSRSLL